MKLFAALWETPSPLTVCTPDGEAQKMRLIESGTNIYEDLWKIVLTEILVCFLWGNLPYYELKQMVLTIYSDWYCDLEFQRILKPVVDSFPHKDSFGSPPDVVTH
jgi:hypothetical protein